MAYFSEADGEAAKNLVQQYIAEASDCLEQMNTAGKSCMDNMSDDEAVEKAYNSLCTSMNAIQLNINDMHAIVKGIEREIEHYRDIRSYSNSF